MKYLLRFKRYNDYSIDDIKNVYESFGVYRIFVKQKELIGTINCKYLKGKYADKNLTKKKILNIIKKHIYNNYLILCFASPSPYDYKRYKHMWKTYTANKGFVLVYSMDKIEKFIHSKIIKNTESFYIAPVEYINKPIDLTEYIDCFLESFHNAKDVEEAINNICNKLKQKQNHSIINYLTSKVKYHYGFENEYRIILNKNQKIEQTHIQIQFIKPEEICILNTLNKNKKNFLINLCKEHNIKYRIVKNSDII